MSASHSYPLQADQPSGGARPISEVSELHSACPVALNSIPRLSQVTSQDSTTEVGPESKSKIPTQLRTMFSSVITGQSRDSRIYNAVFININCGKRGKRSSHLLPELNN